MSAARQIVAAKLEIGDDVRAAVDRINACLPDDVRVFDAVRVTKSFDSKRLCDRRRYVYLLPTALLAPTELIDSAFESAGYGADRVEAVRTELLNAKRAEGSAPFSRWSLTDDARLAIARALGSFQVSQDLLAALRAALEAYLGTRNFHNFTAGLKATDAAAKRYLISFTAGEPFASDVGHQWIQLEVIGQSFLLHQIRKMVAVAAEVARTRRSPDTIHRLLDEEVHLPVQLVPGNGLYLGEPIFDAYNRFKADPDAGRPRLEWLPGHPNFDAIEDFRTTNIQTPILGNDDSALDPWIDYLWQRQVFGTRLAPEDPVPDCNNPDLFGPQAAPPSPEPSPSS